MAKKNVMIEAQGDLFPAEPGINGLSISSFSVKDGTVSTSLSGATLVDDVAKLTDECWKKAIAEWLVKLCGNEGGLIQGYIDEQRKIIYDRAEEERIKREALAAIEAAKFPPSAALALAG